MGLAERQLAFNSLYGATAIANTKHTTVSSKYLLDSYCHCRAQTGVAKCVLAFDSLCGARTGVAKRALAFGSLCMHNIIYIITRFKINYNQVLKVRPVKPTFSELRTLQSSGRLCMALSIKAYTNHPLIYEHLAISKKQTASLSHQLPKLYKILQTLLFRFHKHVCYHETAHCCSYIVLVFLNIVQQTIRGLLVLNSLSIHCHV